MKRLPHLKAITERLPEYAERIQGMKEQIITNAILIGQIPPVEANIKGDDVNNQTNLRVKAYLDRLSEFGLQEATTDIAGNAVGIIRGEGTNNACVAVTAHMDTVYHFDQEINFLVSDTYLSGPGIIDNSISLGVLLSLPEILEQLKITLSSDILLLALPKSLGEHNLSGIRQFLEHWQNPLKAAVVLEGGELGRLNYFSRAMMRLNINCHIPVISGWENKYGDNAIIILNEIMNKILEIYLPQRPHTQIIIGQIRGGVKHGDLALSAKMGLEIESAADTMVQEIYSKIVDIADSVGHEYLVDISIDILSNVNANRLEYTHPLVKTAVHCVKSLEIMPVIESSESELSIFLESGIPAITIGLTKGENYHTEDARIAIEPLAKGIAQLVAIIEAIDKGVMDE